MQYGSDGILSPVRRRSSSAQYKHNNNINNHGHSFTLDSSSIISQQNLNHLYRDINVNSATVPTNNNNNNVQPLQLQPLQLQPLQPQQQFIDPNPNEISKTTPSSSSSTTSTIAPSTVAASSANIDHNDYRDSNSSPPAEKKTKKNNHHDNALVSSTNQDQLVKNDRLIRTASNNLPFADCNNLPSAIGGQSLTATGPSLNMVGAAAGVGQPTISPGSSASHSCVNSCQQTNWLEYQKQQQFPPNDQIRQSFYHDNHHRRSTTTTTQFLEVEIVQYIDHQRKLLKRLQQVLEADMVSGENIATNGFQLNSQLNGSMSDAPALVAQSPSSSGRVTTEYCSRMSHLLQESYSVLNEQMGRSAAFYALLADGLRDFKQFCNGDQRSYQSTNVPAIVRTASLDSNSNPIIPNGFSNNILDNLHHQQHHQQLVSQTTNGRLLRNGSISSHVSFGCGADNRYCTSATPEERSPSNTGSDTTTESASTIATTSAVADERMLMPYYLSPNNNNTNSNHSVGATAVSTAPLVNAWIPDYLWLSSPQCATPQCASPQLNNTEGQTHHHHHNHNMSSASCSYDQSSPATSSTQSRSSRVGAYSSNRYVRQNQLNLFEHSRKHKGKQQMASSEHACSNCRSRITPQWRFLDQDRYCNACYMRYKRSQTNNASSSQNQKRGSPISQSINTGTSTNNTKWQTNSSTETSPSSTQNNINTTTTHNSSNTHSKVNPSESSKHDGNPKSLTHSSDSSSPPPNDNLGVKKDSSPKYDAFGQCENNGSDQYDNMSGQYDNMSGQYDNSVKYEGSENPFNGCSENPFNGCSENPFNGSVQYDGAGKYDEVVDKFDNGLLDGGVPFTLGLDWMNNSFNEIIDTSSLSFGRLDGSTILQEERSSDNLDFLSGSCGKKEAENKIRINPIFQYNVGN